MDVILDLEAQASAALQAQPGLLDLLAFLRASGVKVGAARGSEDALQGLWEGHCNCH